MKSLLFFRNNFTHYNEGNNLSSIEEVYYEKFFNKMFL